MAPFLKLCLALVTVVAKPAAAQLIRCSSDSPERQGKPGCTIVSDKRLPAAPSPPVLWHIDEFPALAQAQQAEGPWSLAIEAYGRAWRGRVVNGLALLDDLADTYQALRVRARAASAVASPTPA